MVRRILAALVAALLGAFFLFVGWNKAFATLPDLARHHAWTVYLPEPAGRLVGWSEMACAAALLAGQWPDLARLARASALILIANQAVAAAVHWQHGETGALPQNLVLVLMLALMAWLAGASIRSDKGECL